MSSYKIPRHRDYILGSTVPPRFNYNRADWDYFREIVHTGIVDNVLLQTPSDIEFQLVHLASLIKFAKNESIPVFPRRNYNMKLAKNTDLHWKKLLQGLRSSNITLKNLEKKVQGHSDPFEKIKPHRNSGNRDEDIAYEFAEVFKQSNETTSSWTHPNDVVVRNGLLSSTSNTFSSSPSFVIKFEDTLNVIESLKPIKSSGPDGIENILIVNLPHSAIILLTEIFNACLELSWPHYFKSAKIFPILKTGKDPSDPQNYRPISLTNTIGKVFEKLVKDKIERFVTDNKIIPPQQFGFRKKTFADDANQTNHLLHQSDEKIQQIGRLSET